MKPWILSQSIYGIVIFFKKCRDSLVGKNISEVVKLCTRASMARRIKYIKDRIWWMLRKTTPRCFIKKLPWKNEKRNSKINFIFKKEDSTKSNLGVLLSFKRNFLISLHVVQNWTWSKYPLGNCCEILCFGCYENSKEAIYSGA